MTLAWDAPKSGSGIAYYSVVEKLRWNFFTVPATQTSFTHTRLWPNSNFTWVVRAVDMNGRPSAESNTVTYRTPADTTAPSAPTLSPLYVGPKLVEVDWTDSVDDVSKVNYAVNVNGNSTPVGTQSYVVWPVAPSSTHSISVTARPVGQRDHEQHDLDHDAGARQHDPTVGASQLHGGSRSRAARGG